MIKTVRTGNVVHRVETLPNGSMGSLSVAVSPVAMTPTFAIEDGLIVRQENAHIPTEYRGQLVKGEQEIIFTIVSGFGIDCAIKASDSHLIVRALKESGWVLREVWRVMPNEF